MRELTGPWRRIVYVIGIAWATFLLLIAVRLTLSPTLVVYGSIGIALVVCFTLNPAHKKSLTAKQRPSFLDIGLMVLSVIVCFYPAVDVEAFVGDPFSFTWLETTFSFTLYMLVFEGTRRTLGLAIPIVSIVFIVFALFIGEFLPGRWWFGTHSYDVLFTGVFYRSGEGYNGTVTTVMTYIVGLFLALGAVLFAVGCGKTFLMYARLLGTKVSGGAAQVAVWGSAFFGMIAGTGTGNVATTGVFTIPAMKKTGFTKEQAGAIEATASTAGQLTPPIMGSTAFILAEFANVPYLRVAAAAIPPSILFYVAVASGIYFLARRNRLGKLPSEESLTFKQISTPANLVNFLVPMGTLIGLLLTDYTPQFSAGMTIVVASLLHLFWGRPSLVRLRERAATVGNAVASAMRTLSWIIVFCTLLQTVVAVVTLTGLGIKLGALIGELTAFSPFLSLVGVAVLAIILGMGLPTSASYIVAWAVLGTALINLGYEGLSAHFFIFYFALMALVTPPTCPGIYAATAISGGKVKGTVFHALRLGIAAYVIPFVFVYRPALLAIGSISEVVIFTFTAAVGIICVSASLFGYFRKPTTSLERILFLGAGAGLLWPRLPINFLGVGLLVLVLLSQRFMPQGSSFFCHREDVETTTAMSSKV
jgi:TRAP transporter 4TM/12TM fusion protein